MPDPIVSFPFREPSTPDDDDAFDDSGDYDADDDDECAQGPGGFCGMAGSEYCDFECPFRG